MRRIRENVDSSFDFTASMVRLVVLCRALSLTSDLKGVVKTHRLTYGNSSSLYAKANRANCTSFWIASSRVLKDW